MGVTAGDIGPARIAIFGMYKSGTTALFYRILNSLRGHVRTLFEPGRYEPEAGDAGARVLAKVILGPLARRTSGAASHVDLLDQPARGKAGLAHASDSGTPLRPR